MEIRPTYLIAGAAVVAAALYVSTRGKSAGNVGQSLAASIAGGAIDLADGVVSGTVETIGGIVGIPATNVPYAVQLMDEWDRTPWYAKAGLSFRISAALPLADYLKWLADASYRPTY